MSARSDWQNEQIERAQNVSTIAALRESLAAKDVEIGSLKEDRLRWIDAKCELDRDNLNLRQERDNLNRGFESVFHNFVDAVISRDEWKTRAEAAEADTRRDQTVMLLISRIVGDDFCEDLDMRSDELSGDSKTLHSKVSDIYKHSHSSVRSSGCFSVHSDWRAATDAAIAAQEPTE